MKLNIRKLVTDVFPRDFRQNPKGLYAREVLIYTTDLTWFRIDSFLKQCRPLYKSTWYESAAKLGILHELD